MQNSRKLIQAFSILGLMSLSLVVNAKDGDRPKSQLNILIETALTKVGTSPVSFVRRIGKPQIKYKDFLEKKELQDLLQSRSKYLELNLNNALAFLNTDADFAPVATRPYGYCGGLTDYTKKMAFLAVFDSANDPRPRLTKEEYVKRLNNIAKGNAERLEGFQNLQQISSDPELQNEIKRITTRMWAEDALEPSGLGIFTKATRPMKYADLMKTIDELEVRVANHELPRILFSAFAPRPQGGKRIHSVMIWKVERLSNGSIQLFAWETNSKATQSEIAKNIIQISPTGEIFYQPWLIAHQDYSRAHPEVSVHPKSGFVAQLLEVKEDRDATAQMALTLKQFCEKNPSECP